MLSLVIPIRDWPLERLEACIASYLRLKSTTLEDILVVDFGSAEPIVLSNPDPRVRVVRVEAEQWSLGEAINIGVVCSRNPVVAKTDADILAAPNSGRALDDSVRAIASGDFHLAVSRTFDLPAEVDASEALSASKGALRRMGTLRSRWGLGGLCLFSVETWNQIGGFDSRFVGWGNEDNDFSDRVRKSGARMRWIDPNKLSVYHVWHEPSFTSKHSQAETARNRELYLQDKSVFRQVRFINSSFERPAKPNVLARHRPLVTVAIATGPRSDRTSMLSECVKSFVGQIDNDFEIVIADNGSSKAEHRGLARSLASLEATVDLRLIHIDHPSIPKARNILADEAGGRYTCIIDDDDLALPNRLADHLTSFENEDGLHGSHGGWIDFDQITGQYETNTGRNRTLGSMLFGSGKVSSHPASFYRTDVMRAVRYDESFVTGSDWDMALRMANLGLRVGHTGSYVTLRRWHAENVTFTRAAEQTDNGRYARRRVTKSLGNRNLTALKAASESRTAQPSCTNLVTPDEVLAALPAHVGSWRLIVPVSSLVEGSHAPARSPRSGPNVANPSPGFELIDRPRSGSTARNGRPVGSNNGKIAGGNAIPEARPPSRSLEIESVLNGDIGIIACGLSPGLHYISDPIRGVAKALKLKSSVEKRLGVALSIMADADLHEKQRAGFDWDKFKTESSGHRVVSRAMTNLDEALSALNRVPADSLPGALITLIADARHGDQVFYLTSKTIADDAEAANIGKILGEFTGEQFREMSDVRRSQPGAVA